MFETSLGAGDFLFLLRGAGVTTLLALVAAAGGTVAGSVLGVLRSFGPPLVRWLLGMLVDLVRSTPLILVLLLLNSVFPILGFRVNPFVSSLVALVIFASAYVCGLVEAGIDSVPKPMVRAARGLGMTRSQELFHIILPIGLRAVFPAWLGQLIGLVKDTSLVMVLGAVPPELMQSAKIITTRVHEPLFILTAAGMIYFVLCVILRRMAEHFASRWRVNLEPVA
jgi:His/Glu/Gln/Arg/opine family amino acid ABC transporter permease subunit